MSRARLAIISAAYLATIVGANWALNRWGFVAVGFGLTAPAGVYFAGLALGLRDALHEMSGARAVVAIIVLGACLSAFIDPKFALASGVAFLLGELADLAIYAPLRERHWTGAVIASNIVGAIVDSVVFLGLAIGRAAITTEGVGGLVLGKCYVIPPALVLVHVVRRRRA